MDLDEPGGFAVTTSAHGNVAILHVRGELDIRTAGQLRAAVADALTSARPLRMIIDLGGLTFCDSSGLAALIATAQIVDQAEGRLVLSRVIGRSRRLLHVT